MGAVIRLELRESDTGARWGGDEFTVLAPNTDRAAAMIFAERIRVRLSQHVASWPLTASIGIATIDPADSGNSHDPSTLMRAADDAMYEAKRRGKNAVVAADKNGAAAAAPSHLS